MALATASLREIPEICLDREEDIHLLVENDELLMAGEAVTHNIDKQEDPSAVFDNLLKPVFLPTDVITQCNRLAIGE